jgi:hypothetical protein
MRSVPTPTRRAMLPMALALAALSAAGVYGCRTLATIDYDSEPPATLAEAPTTPEAAPPLTQTTFVPRDSGVLVGPLEQAGSLEAGVFWPDADRTDRFMITNAESDEPALVTRSIRTQPDGSIEVVRAPDDASRAPDFGARTVLERTPEGEVVVRFNAASKIESTFDPASLFLPKTLEAGESVKRPFTVDAKGPRFGTGIGEGSITVTGRGTQAVRTPAGEFRTFVFESVSSFKIGPATIERTRHAWVATDPGLDAIGIVAEESAQTVKVFGISFSSKSWVSVLSGAGGTDERP